MSTSTPTQEVEESKSLGGKLLSFALDSESYGVAVLKVREIMGLVDITSIPRTPDFVRGVINLRGKVIPVIDMRLKFGMPERDYTQENCIIVVETARENGSTVEMGLIVDAVQEVQDVPASSIEPPPTFGSGVDTDFILGIAKVEKDVIVLLDIDRVLTDSELAKIDTLASKE